MAYAACGRSRPLAATDRRQKVQFGTGRDGLQHSERTDLPVGRDCQSGSQPVAVTKLRPDAGKPTFEPLEHFAHGAAFDIQEFQIRGKMSELTGDVNSGHNVVSFPPADERTEPTVPRSAGLCQMAMHRG